MSRRRRKRATPRSESAPQERAVLRTEAARPASGGRRLGRAAVLVGLAAVAAVAAISSFVVLTRPARTVPMALIVDQLGQTFPNPTFVNEAGTLLAQAGYRVHYTPYQNVTVDFYRQLGTSDYDIILLRAHVARLRDKATQKLGDDALLFTSQPYSDTMYVKEQRARLLTWAAYSEGADLYFGVMPEFITSAVRGNLHGATVVLMGCHGLRNDKMAAALVKRGARVVIGWDDLVSADHSDQATERLLQHLIVDKQSAGEAVAKTMAEVGPDPSYGSTLRLYPPEEAAFALP